MPLLNNQEEALLLVSPKEHESKNDAGVCLAQDRVIHISTWRCCLRFAKQRPCQNTQPVSGKGLHILMKGHVRVEKPYGWQVLPFI